MNTLRKKLPSIERNGHSLQICVHRFVTFGNIKRSQKKQYSCCNRSQDSFSYLQDSLCKHVWQKLCKYVAEKSSFTLSEYQILTLLSKKFIIDVMLHDEMLHTYAHNYSLQPFSFSSLLDLCMIISYMIGVTNGFSRLRKTDNRENLYGNSAYSQSFCHKPAERKSPKKYFFKFTKYLLLDVHQFKQLLEILKCQRRILIE